ncbi:hypothetical protein L596_012195 [Steinernema carpocapsae]|uniref:Rx N-terminal domain-containing protein n=1 Tax=Steinernema carpocapsae TaxID=34508 RepID=A0A4U5NWY9_STECR|nr:hypothetical protein L596_012195 [Steinernema carpocapsae]
MTGSVLTRALKGQLTKTINKLNEAINVADTFVNGDDLQYPEEAEELKTFLLDLELKVEDKLIDVEHWIGKVNEQVEKYTEDFA